MLAYVSSPWTFYQFNDYMCTINYLLQSGSLTFLMAIMWARWKSGIVAPFSSGSSSLKICDG